MYLRGGFLAGAMSMVLPVLAPDLLIAAQEEGAGEALLGWGGDPDDEELGLATAAAGAVGGALPFAAAAAFISAPRRTAPRAAEATAFVRPGGLAGRDSVRKTFSNLTRLKAMKPCSARVASMRVSLDDRKGS